MARIFISYSRADRPFLNKLLPYVHNLCGSDSVWFDADIPGGADWWKMILSEIGKCDLFIYLISNESLESPYCQDEFREALRLNKPFLPIVVRRLKPTYPGNLPSDLAGELRRIQYVDLSNGLEDTLGHDKTLYNAMRHLLGQSKETKSAFLQQDSEVIFTSNFANSAKCNWQGLAGQVKGRDGNPLKGIQVHIIDESALTKFFVKSGTNTLYGPAGWEQPLDNKVSASTYFVELLSDDGEIISNRVRVDFPGDCEKNLALVNFIQI